MADTAKALDVTWDDVRKGKRIPSPRRAVVFFLLTTCFLGALLIADLRFGAGLEAREDAGSATLSRATATPTSIPKKLIHAAPQRIDLCQTLVRWSETTVLELGPETSERCERHIIK